MSQKIANPTNSAIAENDAPKEMIANENKGRNPNQTANAVDHSDEQQRFLYTKAEEHKKGIKYTGF